MTVHSLYPGFLIIDYHSTYAAHKMTIPTRAWNPLGGTAGFGGFVAWDDSDRDLQDMVNDLVTVLRPLVPTTVTFDGWVQYSMADEEATPLPRASAAIALAGSASTAGVWWAAVQKQFVFYDTEFQTFKSVILDAMSGNDFSRRDLASLATEDENLIGEFVAETNAWSSRAGNRPQTIRSVTIDLNDKLRNQYGFA